VIAVIALLVAIRMSGRMSGIVAFPRRYATLAALVLLSIVMAGVSGCRGGFIASPQQSFSITVTGTSGVQSHSTPITLNIR